MGQPADLTYPTCTGTLACASTVKRKVYYGYTYGGLTSVGPYYATAIAYHPNGMTSAVTHGKRIVTTEAGVVDQTTIDGTTYAPRPTSIGTSGVTSGGSPADWSTGTYAYDAAGNVTAVGSDTFSYDRVSRLTSATVAGTPASFSYDVHGNVSTYATSPATNRLTGGTYATRATSPATLR